MKCCGVTEVTRFIPADGLQKDLTKKMALELGSEE